MQIGSAHTTKLIGTITVNAKGIDHYSLQDQPHIVVHFLLLSPVGVLNIGNKIIHILGVCTILDALDAMEESQLKNIAVWRICWLWFTFNKYIILQYIEKEKENPKHRKKGAASDSDKGSTALLQTK